jgi:hypothetical protein
VAHSGLTAQADGAAKQIAVWAVTLADEAFTTIRAFVGGLRHHGAATLEFLAQALQVGQVCLVAEAKRTLLWTREQYRTRDEVSAAPHTRQPEPSRKPSQTGVRPDARVMAGHSGGDVSERAWRD